MRPFRPACRTVSNAQLLTLPEIIRIIAPGVVTTQLSSLPPASSSATEVAGSSERRLATAQPPEPPPTTTKSTLSIVPVPPCLLLATRLGPSGTSGKSARLQRFRAKACPALDAGWIPVRVKKTRQNKRLEPRF